MENPLKMVKLKDDTHAELVKIGGYDDTMDDIIKRCIKAYQQLHGASKDRR